MAIFMGKGIFNVYICNNHKGYILLMTNVNTCNHSESVHEEVGYPCDKCINKSIKKYKLKTHKESVNEELIYPCDKCVNKFIKKCKLKTHK